MRRVVYYYFTVADKHVESKLQLATHRTRTCNLDTAQTFDMLPWHVAEANSTMASERRSTREPVTRRDAMWHDVTHCVTLRHRLHSTCASAEICNSKDTLQGFMLPGLSSTELWRRNFGSICFPGFLQWNNVSVRVICFARIEHVAISSPQFLDNSHKRGQRKSYFLHNFTMNLWTSVSLFTISVFSVCIMRMFVILTFSQAGLNMFPIILQGGAGTCLSSVARWICCSTILY